MDKGFEISLRKALGAHGGLRPHVYHFAQLPAKVAARMPLEVVAISGAELIYNNGPNLGPEITAHARTLALRGMGVEEAHKLAEMFFAKYPDFVPDMARLMTREMLMDEFGTAIGFTLARTIVEPKENPIVYELLFGSHQGDPVFTPVARECVEAIFSAGVVTLKNGTQKFGDWELRSDKALPDHEASYLYNKYTGGTLQRVVFACNNEEYRNAVICYPKR